jgi:hypothetical protein
MAKRNVSKGMFKRVLIAGWGALFTGTAFLLLFPKVIVGVLSPAVLLGFSLLLVVVSVTYGLVLIYRRVTKRGGSVS